MGPGFETNPDASLLLVAPEARFVAAKLIYAICREQFERVFKNMAGAGRRFEKRNRIFATATMTFATSFARFATSFVKFTPRSRDY